MSVMTAVRDRVLSLPQDKAVEDRVISPVEAELRKQMALIEQEINCITVTEEKLKRDPGLTIYDDSTLHANFVPSRCVVGHLVGAQGGYTERVEAAAKLTGIESHTMFSIYGATDRGAKLMLQAELKLKRKELLQLVA